MGARVGGTGTYRYVCPAVATDRIHDMPAAVVSVAVEYIRWSNNCAADAVPTQRSLTLVPTPRVRAWQRQDEWTAALAVRPSSPRVGSLSAKTLVTLIDKTVT